MIISFTLNPTYRTKWGQCIEHIIQIRALLVWGGKKGPLICGSPVSKYEYEILYELEWRIYFVPKTWEITGLD